MAATKRVRVDRAMVTEMRVVGNEEGKGDDKKDGGGNCVPTNFLLLESERINSRGETIHFRLHLEAQSRRPCISPTNSDDINKLAFPIEYHPFLVNLERGAVRWQVDEMMPSQKRFRAGDREGKGSKAMATTT